jgi:hypothetical protein
MDEPLNPFIMLKDFRLFGALKKDLTEKRFAKDVHVKQAVTSLLTLV